MLKVFSKDLEYRNITNIKTPFYKGKLFTGVALFQYSQNVHENIKWNCEIHYKNGIHSRIDGPATYWLETGESYWFYDGNQIHCKTNEEFLRIIKLIVFK